MTDANEMSQQTTEPTPEERAWAAPAPEALPPLTSLTLASIPGRGIISEGAGSTVF